MGGLRDHTKCSSSDCVILELVLNAVKRSHPDVDRMLALLLLDVLLLVIPSFSTNTIARALSMLAETIPVIVNGLSGPEKLGHAGLCFMDG
jgi:hypothetical protein